MNDYGKVEEHIRELREQIRSSEMTIMLFTKNYGYDHKGLIELAATILENKPILLIVEQGAQPGAMLLELAHTVEYFDGQLNKINNERISTAVQRMMDNLGYVDSKEKS